MNLARRQTMKQSTRWLRSFAPRWKFLLALLVFIAGFGIWRGFFYRSQVERGLIALNKAYKNERPLEVRVTGMSYAPHSDKRGSEQQTVDDRARNLSGELLLTAASNDLNASSLHALGRYYLLQKEFDKAIRQFQEALKSSPDAAQLHADLGAALLEKAKLFRDGREPGKAMEHLAESYEQLSSALKVNPSLAEASFNRALVLKEMMLPEQTRKAWQKYVELDPQSGWSSEAQRGLESIPARSQPPTPEQLLASFLKAFREHDEGEAWRILGAGREVITGGMVSLRLAHEYVVDYLKGQNSEAKEKLNALVFAGELDRRMAGDPYTMELAGYYRDSPTPTLRLLLRAIDDVNQGYALCLSNKYADAQSRFVAARATFDAAGDHWEAKLVDYWIAYCLSQPGRTLDSIAILEPLAAYSEQHGYKWLLSLTSGWLGGAHTTLHDYSTAIKYHQQSLALGEQISDGYETQRALLSLGDLYASLGQSEASLGYHYRNLRLTSTSGATARQAWRNLTYFGGTLYAFKHYDSAQAVINEALTIPRTEFGDPALLYLQYLNLGRIYSKLGRFDEAIAQAEVGLNIAQSVQDPKARRKPVANAVLRQADIRREAGQCEQAIANYNQAIALDAEMYEDVKSDVYRYAAYKGRLLCGRALGDDAAVGRDLITVLDLFEKHRSQIREEQNRNSFFDTEQSVYDLAVEYEHEKRNDVVAVNYAEASRSRSLLDAVESGGRIHRTSTGPEMAFDEVSKPIGVEDIRERMPKRLRVLMYSVLPSKLLIWSISHDDFSVSEQAIPADALATDVNSYIDALTTERSTTSPSTIALGAKLFGTLLQSVAKKINSDEILCIIPDKFLHRLPFAALVSPDGKYLVEDMTIFYAPSLSVLAHCTETGRTKAANGRGTILSVGDPFFDVKAYPDLPRLRGAEREARAVAEIYGSSSPLLGSDATKQRVSRQIDSAEVIHFAGHYVINDSSPLLSKMLLAADGRKSEPDNGSTDLSAFEIISHPLNHTKLVILSACQTGLDQYHDSEGPVGLARAFMVAGVPIVVASQWPVDSDVTATLMISFHRYRRSGLSTLESLKRAQVDVLRGQDPSYRAPFYWAAFLCAGGYVEY